MKDTVQFLLQVSSSPTLSRSGGPESTRGSTPTKWEKTGTTSKSDVTADLRSRASTRTDSEHQRTDAMSLFLHKSLDALSAMFVLAQASARGASVGFGSLILHITSSSYILCTHMKTIRVRFTSYTAQFPSHPLITTLGRG